MQPPKLTSKQGLQAPQPQKPTAEAHFATDELVGEALASVRNKVVIATKFRALDSL